jgi:hypothetical protein
MLRVPPRGRRNRTLTSETSITGTLLLKIGGHVVAYTMEKHPTNE